MEVWREITNDLPNLKTIIRSHIDDKDGVIKLLKRYGPNHKWESSPEQNLLHMCENIFVNVPWLTKINSILLV